MADPIVVTCAGACTVTHEISVPPLQLDTTEGGQIAGAVLVVWAVGYSFRSLIRAMRVDEPAGDKE